MNSWRGGIVRFLPRLQELTACAVGTTRGKKRLGRCRGRLVRRRLPRSRRQSDSKQPRHGDPYTHRCSPDQRGAEADSSVIRTFRRWARAEAPPCGGEHALRHNHRNRRGPSADRFPKQPLLLVVHRGDGRSRGDASQPNAALERASAPGTISVPHRIARLWSVRSCPPTSVMNAPTSRRSWVRSPQRPLLPRCSRGATHGDDTPGWPSSARRGIVSVRWVESRGIVSEVVRCPRFHRSR